MLIRSFNKELFVLLIDNLNAQRIEYCIIGDYENLPESIGHDVDLWTNDVKTFHNILERTVHECGFSIIIDNHNGTDGFNMAVFKHTGNDELTLMKWDVMSETGWKSILTLVTSQEMEASITPFKDFFIASPEPEALMHFLYPMFEWGYIKKEKYKVEILQYCESCLFNDAFSRLWGESDSRKVLALIKNESWKQLETLMPSLKRKALIRASLDPKFWRNIWGAMRGVVRRWFKPSGKVLAFCGLDGAGKTTILDELNNMFVDLLKSKKVFYGYWRPYILLEMRELFGKKNSKTGIDKETQKGKTIIELEKKPKGKIASLVKFFYFWIDYMLAPLKYGSIRQRGGMVLFDRHYIDMVVHPQRFEMNISRGLMQFLYKFIPKPDYTFFLWCTPEEILARKQEFSKEEIQQMIDDYNNVGKHFKNFVPIHTNTTITQEIHEILRHVSEGK